MRTLAHIAKRPILLGLISLACVSTAAAQDDGIYEDIYQAPPVEEETPASNPLDGYSTYDQDDYYQPQNSNTQSQTPATSEQYVDEDGNTYVTNNYYGDDDYDYYYASRINRFYRPIYGYGYYDPFYTNMYMYNNDPFYYGTSIYAGWGWNSWNRPWGYNSWGWGIGYSSWGFNSWGYGGGWGYSPYCYGGGWGYGGGYGWNSYNHGYWNGYYDGMAYGNGYYNTYDQNSGIYYGHRGGRGTSGGSGFRSTSFAETYNRAATEGKVSHANRDNVLQTADARPVTGRTNVDGYTIGRTNGTTKPLNANDRSNAQPSKETFQRTNTPVRTSESRGDAKPATQTTNRAVDRYSTPSSQGREVIRPEGSSRQVSGQPQRTPQAAPQRTQSSDIDRSRPRVYEAPNRVQEQQGNREVYQRGGTPNTARPIYQQPSRQQPTYDRAPRPAEQQPSRNYNPSQQPSRQMAPTQSRPSRDVAPQRNEPSRNVSPRESSPSRSVSPSPSPSRGGSFSSPGGGGGSRGGSSGGRRGG